MIKLFPMFIKMHWILWKYMLQFLYQVSQIGKIRRSKIEQSIGDLNSGFKR